MKDSEVIFDFDSLRKNGFGVASKISTPTMHLNKKGHFSIYCISEKFEQVRFSKSGSKVGIEFLEVAKYNSYSINYKNGKHSGKSKTLMTFIDLEKAIGTDYCSANFPLYQQSENVLWFELSESMSKNKPINKRTEHPIKALRNNLI